MVLALAAIAPKIIIPSFFITHKLKDEKDIGKIFNTIAFTVMFAATVIILFHDRMPWIALITCMSAVLFYQRSEGITPQTPLIYALSLAIMALTFCAYGLSGFASLGFALYATSYFVSAPVPFVLSHVLGLLGFAYGVHDPSLLKEIAAIGEHLA